MGLSDGNPMAASSFSPGPSQPGCVGHQDHTPHPSFLQYSFKHISRLPPGTWDSPNGPLPGMPCHEAPHRSQAEVEGITKRVTHEPVHKWEEPLQRSDLLPQLCRKQRCWEPRRGSPFPFFLWPLKTWHLVYNFVTTERIKNMRL